MRTFIVTMGDTTAYGDKFGEDDVARAILGYDGATFFTDVLVEEAVGDDVRPREGEPGFSDVTCGNCGQQFGTNFRTEDIECFDCEARRCPRCFHWFGEDIT